MSAIKFVNASSIKADFFLYQGINRITRFGVYAGGSAAVPTTTEYTVQAFTSMGEFSLASNRVSFTQSSITLLAQMLEENGFYDFQLAQRPGVAPSTITLENAWSSAVQFRLTRPNSPFQTVTVVDEHNTGSISIAQQWTAYAIVNGITTKSVTFSDPQATVTLTADDNDEFGLTIS